MYVCTQISRKKQHVSVFDVRASNVSKRLRRLTKTPIEWPPPRRPKYRLMPLTDSVAALPRRLTRLPSAAVARKPPPADAFDPISLVATDRNVHAPDIISAATVSRG